MTSAIFECVILQGSSLPRTKALGQLAAPLRMLSPVDTGSSPQPCAGGRRVQLPGGAGSIPACTGQLQVQSRRLSTQAERVRCAACLHARMHISCAHAHARSIIITDHEFACARLAPRSRLANAIFACVVLAGSSLSRTKDLGEVLHHELYVAGGCLDGSHPSSLTDDYQFELPGSCSTTTAATMTVLAASVGAWAEVKHGASNP